MNLSEIRLYLSQAGLLTFDGTRGADPEILSVGCNSREAEAGQLFFCKGVRFKPEYLADALGRGACAYVAQSPLSEEVPYLLVSDIRKAMPLIARAFYDCPDAKYPLVGITGTKGKTSCAYQLASIFRTAFGERYGIISTNEARCCGVSLPKSGTTPEALELYGLLNTFARDGVRGAVMEVSSQGLQYDRVLGIEFAVGIYLNLSPDHISPTEHKDFEEYKAAKRKMLTLCRTGIVNLDDPYAREMISAATCKRLITVSLSDPNATYRADHMALTTDGMTFTVRGGALEGARFTLNMAGEFNVSNALCALAAAVELGIPLPALQEGLSQARIKGRMEQFDVGGVRVIVDYAHNGLSFEKVFDFADRFFPEARKIVVYGCPGNKALDRRTEMSDVAGQRADFVVLTDDDPAEEDPDAIMDEAQVMLLAHGADFVRIHDRPQAIAHAVSLCRPGDLLLLLGKGHETGQAVRGKNVPYGGDRAAAEAAFTALISTV